MAWYHRSRERLQRTPNGKPAPAPTKEQQKTKLAEFEEFKVAPLAMSENLPVPVDAKTLPPAPTANLPATTTQTHAKAPTPAPAAQPAPVAKSTSAVKPKEKPKGLFGTLKWAFTEEETETEEETKKKAEEAKAKAKEPEPKPEVKPVQAQAARNASPAPKAAPKVAPVVVTVNQTGLTSAEIAALKAKETALEVKVDRARQDFKALAANEENAEKAYKEYPAYAKRCIGQVEEMIDMADERADAQAASRYRKIIIEIRRDEPPKPKDEKPTFKQYMDNPSRYRNKGKTGVSSTYHPTKKDLAAQPFQPIKGGCTGWSVGYKAAENCKNCRAMGEAAGEHIHCPCGCGSYVPIDRNYNPFGGEASPEFKEGKSSTRLW